MDWLKHIISENFAAITGLLGVYIGAWLTNRQNRTQKKLDFYEKQLRELYSPLAGIRKEIGILSEFRVEGGKASQEWWQKVCDVAEKIEDPDKANEYCDKEGEKIPTLIEYDNNQLTEKIIPSYRKMKDTFENNYWLAEEETKKYFPTLIKFVETWERFLSKSHPIEALKKYSVKEGELLPFYEHIDGINKLLKEKLKNSKE
ncbi:MAG: hypothetical protein PHW04_04700 [Candidatus Wallbacteria bacterium]|nr:hypothetical protein [Candidatus Wallbacteria bacterium]